MGIVSLPRIQKSTPPRWPEQAGMGGDRSILTGSLCQLDGSRGSDRSAMMPTRRAIRAETAPKSWRRPN